MVPAAKLVDIFSFGTQLYLGAGRTVAARAETINDVGECDTEQMILVVHNFFVKAIHNFFPQDALGLAKAYFSVPCFRKTFEQKQGKMGSYTDFTANTAIANLLAAYTHTAASRS